MIHNGALRLYSISNRHLKETEQIWLSIPGNKIKTTWEVFTCKSTTHDGQTTSLEKENVDIFKKEKALMYLFAIGGALEKRNIG